MLWEIVSVQNDSLDITERRHIKAEIRKDYFRICLEFSGQILWFCSIFRWWTKVPKTQPIHSLFPILFFYLATRVFITIVRKGKYETVWLHHTMQQRSHCHPTIYHLRRKKKKRREKGNCPMTLLWETGRSLHSNFEAEPRHIGIVGQVFSDAVIIRIHALRTMIRRCRNIY